VIHTTETSGLPSYKDGYTAPHLTYDPEFGNFYQHTDLNVAARALTNPPGGVQTNRQSALQLEIICYSNKRIADQTKSRLWVGDLTDKNYADLEDFVDFCVKNYRVKPVWPGKQAFSYSQANAPGFRMTGAQWVSYSGVCGHQHIPEQTHWDPGALNWNQLLEDDDMRSPKDWTKEDWTAFTKNNIGASAFPGGPDNGSVWQNIIRIKADTAAIRNQVMDIDSDLEGLAEALTEIAISEGVAEDVADLIAQRLVE